MTIFALGKKKKIHHCHQNPADLGECRSLEEEILFFPLGVTYKNTAHTRTHTLNWSEIFWCLQGSCRLIPAVVGTDLICTDMQCSSQENASCGEVLLGCSYSGQDIILHKHSYILLTFRHICFIQKTLSISIIATLTAKINYSPYQTKKQ